MEDKMKELNDLAKELDEMKKAAEEALQARQEMLKEIDAAVQERLNGGKTNGREE